MLWNRLTADGRELLLAAGLTIVVEVGLALTGGGINPAVAAAALLIALPMAFRLQYPLAVLATSVAGAVAVTALGAVPAFPIIAILLALYAVGSRTTGVSLAVGGAIAAGGLFVAFRLSSNDLGTSVAVPLLVTASGLIIGSAVGVLRFESEEFAERASQLERERDERARIAVAEERRRIARELHDVVGHSISVMGVQAGAVRSVLREDQSREREMLLAVESIGREAVGEMRRLIGLLRTEEDGSGHAPPSLRRVEQLVSEVRQSGLIVELNVEGDVQTLSPGVDLAGFRVLQEALTNVLKHAEGAKVYATVTCHADELAIEVIDDGGLTPKPSRSHVGHGLLGMRERVLLYGGELNTGPCPGGGFAIRARIPRLGS